MIESEIITTAEQLLLVCESCPNKFVFIRCEGVTVNIQMESPIIYIGYIFGAMIPRQFSTSPVKLTIPAELHQRFLTLQRTVVAAKRKNQREDARPATYKLDETEFLAYLLGEVRRRKLQALLA
jgi:hypothetical protein